MTNHMQTNHIQNMFADRIGGVSFGQNDQTYKFERIKVAKRNAIRLNPTIDLLDLGVGEPDWMADKQVVATLVEEACKSTNRGYADNGCTEFKHELIDWRVYLLNGEEGFLLK